MVRILFIQYGGDVTMVVKGYFKNWVLFQYVKTVASNLARGLPYIITEGSHPEMVAAVDKRRC